jgi:hypothetical protein
MTCTTKDVAELAARLAIDHKTHKQTLQRSAGLEWRHAAEDAIALHRAATALQRLAENECNGVNRWDAKACRVMAQWTEADQEQADKKRDGIKSKVMDILHNYRVVATSEDGDTYKARFQRDPRGCMIRFSLKSSGAVLL